MYKEVGRKERKLTLIWHLLSTRYVEFSKVLSFNSHNTCVGRLHRNSYLIFLQIHKPAFHRFMQLTFLCETVTPSNINRVFLVALVPVASGCSYDTGCYLRSPQYQPLSYLVSIPSGSGLNCIMAVSALSQ